MLGDDIEMNFSDACREIFNQCTISEHMLEIGLVYTDENKQTSLAKKWKTLEECSFLKRGFRYEKLLDRYVGPLALESILETPYWSQKGSQRDSITKTSTETSLLELALHDEDTFNEWSKKIIDAYNAEFQDPLISTSRIALILKSDGMKTEW